MRQTRELSTHTINFVPKAPTRRILNLIANANIYKKDVEPVLMPVPRSKALALPD